jgi:hypothetical protein
MELQFDRKIANKRIFQQLIWLLQVLDVMIIIRSKNVATHVDYEKIPFWYESSEAMDFINDRLRKQEQWRVLDSMNTKICTG